MHRDQRNQSNRDRDDHVRRDISPHDQRTQRTRERDDNTRRDSSPHDQRSQIPRDRADHARRDSPPNSQNQSFSSSTHWNSRDSVPVSRYPDDRRREPEAPVHTYLDSSRRDTTHRSDRQDYRPPEYDNSRGLDTSM